MGAADGVIGLPEGWDTLPYNIKFIYNVGGNALLNQHGSINRTIEILQDESLVRVHRRPRAVHDAVVFADVVRRRDLDGDRRRHRNW